MLLFLLQQSAHSHTRTHTDIQTHTHNNILPVVLKHLDIRTRKQFEELRILMVNDSVREVQMKLWYQCFRRESVETVYKEKSNKKIIVIKGNRRLTLREFDEDLWIPESSGNYSAILNISIAHHSDLCTAI